MKDKTQLDYPGMHQDASPKIFQFAEELRKNMTEAEIALWNALKGKKLRGFKI